MKRARWTRRALALVSTSVALWASSELALAWNDIGHRLIVEKAIDALPGDVKKFYESREDALNEMVSDPTRFGPRLVFEVDRLEAFPFFDLPADRKLAVRKYGEDTLKEVGDLPWRLIESYQALVQAFEKGSYGEALDRSAEIAYYVGELYAPPNVSKNGDGEPTGQQGLRERFDSRLLEVVGDKLKVETPSAIYLDHPEDYAVSIPLKSYIWVDNLLYFDYLSRRGVSSYDRYYYDGMWIRARPVVENLLGSAALDVSSFWYTAWIDARKPELPKD